ncbi:MAG: SDR family NAD(P)-dependent oxidoreductase [Candidatus Melainabacteria bacterium]|nr:MAG: SDR family NAD(P)-dependent oxidoreductase [Candidatus Melainabacteria bacterium]
MSDRVLIFGGSGMLGHKLSQVISHSSDAFVTLRDKGTVASYPQFFERARVIDGVDAQDQQSVASAFQEVRPDVVINSIGVVKQLDTSNDAVISIGVNSLFPHRLAELCSMHGVRLITISTDCVFSGARGNYKETENPDCVDLYGRSKMLGEVQSENALTIRTSIIGRQIHGSHALLEWFLSQQGKTVKGYKKAIFTGWPTLILSEIIAEIIAKHRDLSGVMHIAANPISKFDLLTLIRDKFGLNIEIEPSDHLDCNRSLNGDLFKKLTGFQTPTWDELVSRMYEDQASYTVPAQLSLK